MKVILTNIQVITNHTCLMMCKEDKTYEEKSTCPVCHMDLEVMKE